MNYKKLTIYSVVINIVMNLLFFACDAFISEEVGYYLFLGIELAIFVVYYVKRYKIKYTKDVVKKDILVGILWIVLSFVLGYLLASLYDTLFPDVNTEYSMMPSMIFIIMGGINMLYALLILNVNLVNLFLKKTGLSDKKNIIISIPTGIITYSLIIYILVKVLQIV